MKTQSTRPDSLTGCTALGTGGTFYSFTGMCNHSIGTPQEPNCWVEFDMDATVQSLGWGWHYYLALFTFTIVLICAYSARERRAWGRQMLVGMF